MKKRALKLMPSGDSKIILVDGLEDMQAAVSMPGETEGMIEGVWSPRFARITIYANKEGHILHHPYNPQASHLLKADLVGPVIILGPDDGEGNETELPESFVTKHFPGLVEQYRTAIDAMQTDS